MSNQANRGRTGGWSRRHVLKAGGAVITAAALPIGLASAADAAAQRSVRYRLTASVRTRQVAGRSAVMWNYNKSFPGPLLRARVNDRIIVEFENQLPDPTTIHWHGVEVPALQDGSNISQRAVQPGETFTYEFVALTAGLFWYHPHAETNKQVEKGLYGALLIEDPAENSNLGIRPGNEHVLILDDILLDENGIAPPWPSDPLENAITHFNGREGNVLLVNGAQRPDIPVRNGTPQRLRLVNASNSRFMRLSFNGSHKLWRVGGDGGLLESPQAVAPIGQVAGGGHGGHGGGSTMSDPDLSKGIMLTPGERADLIWLPVGDNRGATTLQWHDWPRGDHGAVYTDTGAIMPTHDPADGRHPPQTLASFRLHGQVSPGFDSYAPPARLRDIARIPTNGAVIPVTMGHGAPDAKGDIVFFMHRDANGPKPFPKLTPADVVTVRPDEVRIIEVTNLTMGAHNFHLHGFFFQHVETQFFDMDTPGNNRTVLAGPIENKDTILVLPRPGAAMRSRSVTRLAVRFDDTGREGQIDAFGKSPQSGRSGGWLMHCHLLEHSASGMLSFIQVRSG